MRDTLAPSPRRLFSAWACALSVSAAIRPALAVVTPTPTAPLETLVWVVTEQKAAETSSLGMMIKKKFPTVFAQSELSPVVSASKIREWIAATHPKRLVLGNLGITNESVMDWVLNSEFQSFLKQNRTTLAGHFYIGTPLHKSSIQVQMAWESSSLPLFFGWGKRDGQAPEEALYPFYKNYGRSITPGVRKVWHEASEVNGCPQNPTHDALAHGAEELEECLWDPLVKWIQTTVDFNP